MFSTSKYVLPSLVRARVTASIATLALTAACSDSTSANRSGVQLAFTSGVSSSANRLLVPITNGGHTLDITQATLTISRIELKRAQTDACAGDDEHDDDVAPLAAASSSSDDDECEELKAGPVSIDLPLTGGMAVLPANAIPAGTFRELEIRVSFVRLVGTFDAKPFDVTLQVNTRGEFAFSTPLVVTDGAATSITIDVPVGGWLTNANGSLIDPTLISSNTTLLAQVRSRIIASFHAFEDEDHDGRDDHSGHG